MERQFRTWNLELIRWRFKEQVLCACVPVKKGKGSDLKVASSWAKCKQMRGKEGGRSKYFMSYTLLLPGGSVGHYILKEQHRFPSLIHL